MSALVKLVPEPYCAGFGTVPDPKGRRNRVTTQVVIWVCILRGLPRGGHHGIKGRWWLWNREPCTGDQRLVEKVNAPEVGHDWVVAPSGDQAGGPRLGGDMTDPVTADGDG